MTNSNNFRKVVDAQIKEGLRRNLKNCHLGKGFEDGEGGQKKFIG
jgi:hypothetical protein